MKLICSFRFSIVLAVFLSALTPLRAAPGDEHWSQEFGWPGVTNNLFAIRTHQDRLYLGNNTTGSTNATVTVWDGARFSLVGRFVGGITTSINELLSHNGYLYAAGSFTNVNGVPVRGLARWDGAAWSGVGLTNGTGGALAANGNDLYLGGLFTNPGGVAATNIARWDGSAWHALGSGLGGTNTIPNDVVRALVVTNGLIYAAGNFSNAGTQALSHVAVWNGVTWSPVGGGISGTTVYGLAWNGSDLFAAGVFSQAGGVPVNNVARWNGTSWSALGDGVNGTAISAAIFNSLLCVGGTFTTAGGNPAANFAVWDGTAWSSAGGNPSASVFRVHATATNVYVGGSFINAAGGLMAGLASWDGNGWRPVGPAGKISGLTSTVRALIGNTSNLYVGGDFSFAGRTNTLRVGRYDGTNWSPFGNGLNDSVTSLALVGTNLYAAGDFNGSLGGPFAYHVARWNGSTWTNLSDSFLTRINRLAARGHDLLIAGYFNFSTPEGTATDLTRWDGTNFHPVLVYPEGTLWLSYTDNIGYTALATDGTNIYVSGYGQTSVCDTNYQNCAITYNVRHFDGQYVRGLGSGLNTNATSIVIMGTNVFFAGPFTSAGGVTANRIARWNGFNWFPVGGGMVGSGAINALAVIGTNLYAGGSFTNLGGTPARRLARWDGTAWSALGSGTAFTPTAGPVFALTAVGNDLYAGGTFRVAGEKPSYYLARWNESRNFNDQSLRFKTPGQVLGGQFFTTINTEGAPTYVIQRSTDLTNWSGVLTSSVTPLSFVDTNAPLGSKHFYRALTVP